LHGFSLTSFLSIFLIPNQGAADRSGRAADEGSGSRGSSNAADERPTGRASAAANQGSFFSVTQWLGASPKKHCHSKCS
jgi:hypothetical protein